MTATVLQFLGVLVLGFLTIGSLLNISTSSHWFIRGWDFPRAQIVGVAVLAVLGVTIVNYFDDQDFGGLRNWFSYGMLVFLVVLHGYRIIPYTPVWRKQTRIATASDPDRNLKMVISNVEMENEQHEKWANTIEHESPDVVVALEINQRWMDALESWRSKYSHEIAKPQENWYGMLVVSRLPIIESKIRYLVEDDVPSIEAKIRLRSGQDFRLIAVHPRPPEPIRDTDSTARDAEMMLHGKELEEETGPVVIGGDLNDVAWSRTTRLFLRISDLLDPRRGRGLYNSFHAQHWLLRFPLDHVFHSQHFTLRCLRRLREVGSDHFPILIELQYEPQMKEKQDSLESSEADRELAEEMIDREEETAET